MQNSAHAVLPTPPAISSTATSTDPFAHIKLPVTDLSGFDHGQFSEPGPFQISKCSNPRMTPEFCDRIAVLGSGKYGTAIADLLSLADNDVAMYARDPQVASDITLNHRNAVCLGDRPLSQTLLASSSRTIALLDRGIIILAVPTASLEEVVASLRPHPDSVIVNLAKGLIVEGWKPDANNGDYAKGPPKGSKVYLPLEFMRRHPNFEQVKSLCMISGPGFAEELKSGNALDLSIAVNYLNRNAHSDREHEKAISKQVAAHIARKFNKAGVTTDLTTDHIGVQVAAAMKNVIGVMVGVCDGLTSQHGNIQFPTNFREKIMRYGMQEAGNIIRWKDGKTRTLLGPCGYPDLHLSTSSLTGRNYSLGRELADGGRIDKVIAASGKVVEGAAGAWAVKLLTDDRGPHKGIYTPVTNALVDIFQAQQSPSLIMSKLMDSMMSGSASEIQEWSSGQGRVGRYKPIKT